MTDYIQFDVKVTQNKRFLVPYNKALELIKEDGEDYSNWNEYDIAEYLYSMQQEITDYEDEDYCDNPYWNDVEITDVNLIG
ncbi:MAG: hypothetical protein J6S67_06555 [Methanobrevibacter sp.]|nr:hypothetical protein [Methanobrevibacter sp.]